MSKHQEHIPVLLSEVLDELAPKVGDKYLDLTAGYGGHAREIIELTKADATLVDRDNNAILSLRETFHDKSVTLVHSDFLQAARELAEQRQTFDLILVDLGVSSPHLDNASRGFSITKNGPLDMRMDSSQQLTADEVVNTYAEAELIRILREYGQEPKARVIAKLIIKHRPIKTTHELAQVVKTVWPYSKHHPATRTFQAIRIEVNDELLQIRQVLPVLLTLIKPQGRLGIISFHSLEDEIVKRFFTEHGGDRYDADITILTKKPVIASPHEIVFNPRARSAKLRVAQRK